MGISHSTSAREARPTDKTEAVISGIGGWLHNDNITNGWPAYENWSIGYADYPQIRHGKRRYGYFEVENKVQAMIVFNYFMELNMVEETYDITLDENVRYIIICHG